jgi:hypothetical protein
VFVRVCGFGREEVPAFLVGHGACVCVIWAPSRYLTSFRDLPGLVVAREWEEDQDKAIK